MKYFFCEIVPYENEIITEYDTLEELKQNEFNNIKFNDNWYVIKGEVIKLYGGCNEI